MSNEQLKIKKTLKDRLKKLFLRAAVTSAVLTTATPTSFAQSSAENDKKTDSRFPAHLQQLDMESNGKSVNRFGEPVNYVTGPIIFGEPGTNGQHSFYQLLHQGTDIVPLQFVGFKANQMGSDVVIQGSTSQQKLCANVAAQIMAFACGKQDDNRNKNFEGGRPSSIIIGDQLTPEAVGALLAHFENKVKTLVLSLLPLELLHVPFHLK